MSDPREPVLCLLRAHLARRLDPHESSMAAQMIAFIEQHPDCAERSLKIGHLTGSAWIVDATRRRTLLTHHRKLNKWLQLGGHADGELDLLSVALREAREESGLTKLRVVSPEIFDVDCHRIPARGAEPEHWHYDIRFMIEADPLESLCISEESHDLAWVEIGRMEDYSREVSMTRMAGKTLGTAASE